MKKLKTGENGKNDRTDSKNDRTDSKYNRMNSE